MKFCYFKKKKLESKITWKKGATFSKPMQIGNAFIDQKLEELKGKTPYEIWKSIFSTEMLKKLVRQINLYANRDKNNKKFKVLKCKMQKFLGIILLSYCI